MSGTCQKAQPLVYIDRNITITLYLLNFGYAQLVKALRRIESAFIKANEGETEEEILRKCQAFIEEHLMFSTRKI